MALFLLNCTKFHYFNNKSNAEKHSKGDNKILHCIYPKRVFLSQKGFSRFKKYSKQKQNRKKLYNSKAGDVCLWFKMYLYRITIDWPVKVSIFAG